MTSGPAGGVVPQVLEEYGGLTRTALTSFLQGPRDAGQLYDLAADYPARGGRSLRASICMASARAFGASADDAVNTAASLELMHNAFLVHDDVEDESEERRGRPALHVMHGVPVAVNVGDALAVMSLRPLIANHARLGIRLSFRILQEAERMARESVEGQAIELGWRRDNRLDLGEADYLFMILKKTCWYTTIYPCRIGALIGTRDRLDLDRFVRFGFFLGAAFQIQDDLLNLVGDHQRYGKELGGDVAEGKRTLMLIHLAQSAAGDERAELQRLLAGTRSQRGPEQIAWIRERMDRYGSIDCARQVAHGLAGAAQHEFEQAYADVPESRDKEFLRSLAAWVLERA